MRRMSSEDIKGRQEVIYGVPRELLLYMAGAAIALTLMAFMTIVRLKEGIVKAYADIRND